MARAKPVPGHKFKGAQVWFQAHCECGWRSLMYGTRGARSQAVEEWHLHQAKCACAEAQEQS